MASAEPTQIQSICYSRRTVIRAERAVRCAPFQLELFKRMRWQSAELRAIAGTAGVEKRYTRRPISELAAENNLLWLIQVGVLRREVDGQGLTDSFRLTPLGRQLVAQWQQGAVLPHPSLIDRLQAFLNRWIQLPSWLKS